MCRLRGFVWGRTDAGVCGQSLRSQSGRAIEEVGGSAGLARAGLERGLARNNEETRDGVRII
jgi:hypothetical protein